MRLARLLLPLGLSDAPARLLQQAAYLARANGAEVVLLHVLTAREYPAGLLEAGHEISERDEQAPAVQAARAALEHLDVSALAGLPLRRRLVRGGTAEQIARVADEEQADLILMSVHPASALAGLLGTPVTARVLQHSERPLWTDAADQRAAQRPFTIQRLLCPLDLGGHSEHTLARAAELAAQFQATLTLLHVTAGMQIEAPGGTQELTELKKELFAAARLELNKLQRACGTQAEVMLDSGNVLAALGRAVERAQADLLVVGRLPPTGHLGDNSSGFGFMRASPIPVLSL